MLNGKRCLVNEFRSGKRYNLVFARKMDRDEYLSRIGLDRTDIQTDVTGLRLLQRAHLLHVPFENLDIHWHRPIVLDTDGFYEKIVVRGRGGFCYELNGLFEQLLKSLGFQTKLISARPFSEATGFGPEFDHAAIIVTISKMEHLVDVGFGDFAAEPLNIGDETELADREGIFRIIFNENSSLVVEKKTGEKWRPEYMFDPRGRELAEFAEMCDFQQYSPESHFKKRKICSILTHFGRKTLTDTKYIVTTKGERTETKIASEDEFEAVLMREFGIRRDN